MECGHFWRGTRSAVNLSHEAFLDPHGCRSHGPLRSSERVQRAYTSLVWRLWSIKELSLLHPGVQDRLSFVVVALEGSG